MRIACQVSLLTAATLWPGSLFSQTSRKPQTDIVERLLLRDYPPKVASLKPDERTAAVKELEAARAYATGKRSQEIVFLLAALGSDYARNRDELINLCTPERRDACDEDTAELLIGLYESGHREVLQPLLTMGPHSDAALAETLGEFYGDLLSRRPLEFLTAIRPTAVRIQSDLCLLAGGEDGSGMPPNDLKQVREQLKHLGDDVALRCLEQIETVNKQIEKDNTP